VIGSSGRSDFKTQTQANCEHRVVAAKAEGTQAEQAPVFSSGVYPRTKHPLNSRRVWVFTSPHRPITSSPDPTTGFHSSIRVSISSAGGSYASSKNHRSPENERA
jgi:hypothetical protein